MSKKIISLIISFCFLIQSIGFSQGLAPFPNPSSTDLPLLKYLSLNSANPFNYFNFLLDKGELINPKPEELSQEAKKLLNYFFLGITLSDESFWVNLQPGQEDRITSSELSKTDLGKILLEQDLLLKKDMANLLNPKNPIGKAFWQRLYKEADKLLGKEKLKKTAINTQNRVWITPDKAKILETEDGALIVEASLKVLLESEYLKLSSKKISISNDEQSNLNLISEELMKEIIIPEITRKVNQSPSYAPLRQIYYSLILAQWFKRKVRNGELTQQTNITHPYELAIDKGDVEGLESRNPWSKDLLFQEYLKSLTLGEYKLQETISGLKRMYFSGGVILTGPDFKITTIPNNISISEIAGSPLGKQDSLLPITISNSSVRNTGIFKKIIFSLIIGSMLLNPSAENIMAAQKQESSQFTLQQQVEIKECLQMLKNTLNEYDENGYDEIYSLISNTMQGLISQQKLYLKEVFRQLILEEDFRFSNSYFQRRVFIEMIYKYKYFREILEDFIKKDRFFDLKPDVKIEIFNELFCEIFYFQYNPSEADLNLVGFLLKEDNFSKLELEVQEKIVKKLSDAIYYYSKDKQDDIWAICLGPLLEEDRFLNLNSQIQKILYETLSSYFQKNKEYLEEKIRILVKERLIALKNLETKEIKNWVEKLVKVEKSIKRNNNYYDYSETISTLRLLSDEIIQKPYLIEAVRQLIGMKEFKSLDKGFQEYVFQMIIKHSDSFRDILKTYIREDKVFNLDIEVREYILQELLCQPFYDSIGKENNVGPLLELFYQKGEKLFLKLSNVYVLKKIVEKLIYETSKNKNKTAQMILKLYIDNLTSFNAEIQEILSKFEDMNNLTSLDKTQEAFLKIKKAQEDKRKESALELEINDLIQTLFTKYNANDFSIVDIFYKIVDLEKALPISKRLAVLYPSKLIDILTQLGENFWNIILGREISKYLIEHGLDINNLFLDKKINKFVKAQMVFTKLNYEVLKGKEINNTLVKFHSFLTNQTTPLKDRKDLAFAVSYGLLRVLYAFKGGGFIYKPEEDKKISKFLYQDKLASGFFFKIWQEENLREEIIDGILSDEFYNKVFSHYPPYYYSLSGVDSDKFVSELITIIKNKEYGLSIKDKAIQLLIRLGKIADLRKIKSTLESLSPQSILAKEALFCFELEERFWQQQNNKLILPSQNFPANNLEIKQRAVEILLYYQTRFSLRKEKLGNILYFILSRGGFSDGILADSVKSSFVVANRYVKEMRSVITEEVDVGIALNAIFFHEMMHNILWFEKGLAPGYKDSGALHEFVADLAMRDYIQQIKREDLFPKILQILRAGYLEKYKDKPDEIIYMPHDAARTQLARLRLALKEKELPINYERLLNLSLSLIEQHKKTDPYFENLNFANFVWKLATRYKEEIKPKDTKPIPSFEIKVPIPDGTIPLLPLQDILDIFSQNHPQLQPFIQTIASQNPEEAINFILSFNTLTPPKQVEIAQLIQASENVYNPKEALVMAQTEIDQILKKEITNQNFEQDLRAAIFKGMPLERLVISKNSDGSFSLEKNNQHKRNSDIDFLTSEQITTQTLSLKKGIQALERKIALSESREEKQRLIKQQKKMEERLQLLAQVQQSKNIHFSKVANSLLERDTESASSAINLNEDFLQKNLWEMSYKELWILLEYSKQELEKEILPVSKKSISSSNLEGLRIVLEDIKTIIEDITQLQDSSYRPNIIFFDPLSQIYLGHPLKDREEFEGWIKKRLGEEGNEGIRAKMLYDYLEETRDKSSRWNQEKEEYNLGPDKDHGGIDLSQIEFNLKDKEFISSLNPVDLKILLAAKTLEKDNWYSLTLLRIHEVIGILRDGIVEDFKNKELLLKVLEQLRINFFLDPQALQFLHSLQSQKPISELRFFSSR